MTLLAGIDIPLLDDVVIITGLSVLVILIFHRFKVPPIVGYLLTGIIAGPYVLKFVHADESVEMLAELGVVLLMFTIGLELSLRTLIRIWRSVFILGGLQVGLAVVIAAVIANQFGIAWPQAVFIGFLASLSSTAIVLKVLQQNMQLDTLHGRNILAILIFQDIIVVPMMLMTPILAGQADNVGLTVLLLLLKVLAVLAFVLVAARYIMPWLLLQVAKTRSRELFILSMVVICFAIAWSTAQIGLSLALGAFMAGLIISESEYSHQATSDILPFREIFASFFFVSVGMLLDVQFFLENPFMILLATLIIILIKFGLIAIAAFVFKLPMRIVLLVGISLAQIGEFSFILSKTGMQYNLLDDELYQYFLAVSIVSMSLTPFMILGAQRLSSLIMHAPIPGMLRNRLKERDQSLALPPEVSNSLNDHLIIIGFGLNGQSVARVAKSAEIPYVVLETNPETVLNYQRKGEPILFGDATMEHILEHAHADTARVAVVAISDPFATEQAVSSLRHLSPNLHIIARTRYVKQVDDLMQLGANEVVPEEFETSIEIFSRVLYKYLVTQDEIASFASGIRADSYGLLRSEVTQLIHTPKQLGQAKLDISTFSVPEGSWLAHKKLQELDLRNTYGINLLAIKRDKQLITDLTGETTMQALDEVFAFGHPSKIQSFCQSLRV